MNTIMIHIFICTIVALLKFYQASVVMIPPDIEYRFIKAKDPSVYNINDDPFDKLKIDQRIELCDLAIKAPTYMWHEKEEDMAKYSELPIMENYQRKFNSYPGLKEELNEPDPIGINLTDHESIPFKRIYCSVFDRKGPEKDEYYQELYISAGEEPDYPFILTRYSKTEPLEVVGIIDKNELVWKATEGNGTSGDLVKSLNNSPASICSLRDQAFNFEICSRVHHHMFPDVDSGEDYDLDEDISAEQYEPDSYEHSSYHAETEDISKSEYTYAKGSKSYKTGYRKHSSSMGDESFKKLKVSTDDDDGTFPTTGRFTTSTEGKFTTAAEEKFTATNEEDVISDTSFEDEEEEDAIDEDFYEDSIKDASYEEEVIDEDARKENDLYDYYDRYAPSVFNWFDQGEKACNTKYVSVDEEKPDTLPVELLNCMLYENRMKTNEVFVALKNLDENKVSVVVMKPKNSFYNEKTSPLHVAGTIDFVRH